VFALYQQVTPQDIRTMAAKYFTETNRTIVTLASKTGIAVMARRILFVLMLGALLQTPAFTQAPSVLQPGTSPLIVFRILFTTGAAYDAAGKEGLASLTAALLAEGGSRSMTYQQIVDAMYPMATSVNWQVDKEMTVFSGTTHVENLDKYYALLKQMLLDPGFRLEDFTRVRDAAVNFIKVSLRESNDEELGRNISTT
jgi:zinc protease